MATLNLFPIRVPIGSVVDQSGNTRDVFMTQEFSRALAGVLDRIGGPTGSSNGEITAMISDLATLEAFTEPPPAAAAAPDAVDLFSNAGVSAQIGGLANAVEDLQRLLASAPDSVARVAEVLKELARRPSTLAQAAPSASVTGTLVATVLSTIAVPANALGKNGMLRITASWSMTNSANNKTLVSRFGGTDISSDVVTTATTYQTQQRIQNKNSTNTQVFIFGGAAFTGSPIGTMAKDTTAAQNIDIVAQLSNIAETITLEAYTVELIPFS